MFVDLSVAVPVANSLTLLFTATTGLLLGEKLRKGKRIEPQVVGYLPCVKLHFDLFFLQSNF